ncbi:MAG: hypothetical protein RRZ73_05485 [Oscillospiraceae bacterium]
MERLDMCVYLCNPDLSDYFFSLPSNIKERLLNSGVEISTLGELKKCAEHFMQG